MGNGQTLKEKIEFSKEGKITNTSWAKYKMPRINDVPGMHMVFCVENPEMRGPYGAMCVAEHPMVAVAAVILNALQDALGHDFFHVPVTPGDIQKVLGGEA